MKRTREKVLGGVGAMSSRALERKIDQGEIIAAGRTELQQNLCPS